MSDLVKEIAARSAKKSVVDVRSGDTVRVHQKIKEGNKERVQVFEGLVIRTDRKQSPTYRITVRKIASGVGVEKGFMVHSPSVVKIEVVKRSKVRRNYLSYIRELTGKSARLSSVDFDAARVNAVVEETEEVAAAEEPAIEEKATAETEEKA